MNSNLQTESKSVLLPSKRVFALTLILALILPPLVIAVAGTFLTHKPESLYLSWTLPNDQAVFAGIIIFLRIAGNFN
jgi:ABC-type Fe3+ transport system permease subunit